MHPKLVVALLLLALAAAPSVAVAQSATDHVDLRLVIAVDTGGNEDINQSTQRQGYEAAFRSADVLRAIQSGPYGKIAVTYVEFTLVGLDTVVIPWTVIANQQDAFAVASKLSLAPINQGPGQVSISAAID